MLNKQKGNMYGFVTHTWNPIKGKCSHDCKYCYMKVWKQKPIRLDENDLNTDLGENNFIFVGSSTDMFADDVPKDWIDKVLSQCEYYSGNTYLIQTKNPKRFKEYTFPNNFWLCITLETNKRTEVISKAPVPFQRVIDFNELNHSHKVVTIEPIMKFDLEEFVEMIKSINPEWVNIGADSKHHGLKEPSWDKVQALVSELERFTEVKVKDNLARLKRGF